MIYKDTKPGMAVCRSDIKSCLNFLSMLVCCWSEIGLVNFTFYYWCHVTDLWSRQCRWSIKSLWISFWLATNSPLLIDGVISNESHIICVLYNDLYFPDGWVGVRVITHQLLHNAHVGECFVLWRNSSDMMSHGWTTAL